MRGASQTKGSRPRAQTTVQVGDRPEPRLRAAQGDGMDNNSITDGQARPSSMRVIQPNGALFLRDMHRETRLAMAQDGRWSQRILAARRSNQFTSIAMSSNVHLTMEGSRATETWHSRPLLHTRRTCLQPAETSAGFTTARLVSASSSEGHFSTSKDRSPAISTAGCIGLSRRVNGLGK